jgi:hypothetical protein
LWKKLLDETITEELTTQFSPKKGAPFIQSYNYDFYRICMIILLVEINLFDIYINKCKEIVKKLDDVLNQQIFKI